MTDVDVDTLTDPSFVVVTARRASVATRVSRRRRGPEIKSIRFLPSKKQPNRCFPSIKFPRSGISIDYFTRTSFFGFKKC